MTQDKRQHRRIEKHISMQFCLADDYPNKWDMSVIENISVGGVKFSASNNLDLNNKIIVLQIKIPELAPLCLELHAKVLNFNLRFDTSICSIVRAEFINLTEKDKELLSVIEKMIDLQEMKNAKKRGKMA